MRTPEEIMRDIKDCKEQDEVDYFYKGYMLEIMCNIAITLEKISKEINDEE